MVEIIPEEEKSEYEKMPDFDESILEWAINTLALMPIKTAVSSFLVTFTEYNDPKYGPPEEIKRLIKIRLENMKYQKGRPYRDMIQARSDAIESSLLDSYPLANPLFHLTEIHNDYFSDKNTPAQKARLRSEALKVVEMLTGVKGTPAAKQGEGSWRGTGASFPPAEEQIPFNQETKLTGA